VLDTAEDVVHVGDLPDFRGAASDGDVDPVLVERLAVDPEPLLIR
jgi:hypothetical protein